MDMTPGLPEAPHGLLAMLSSKGLLRQPEVVVIQSIAWLCGLAEDVNPLASLVRAAGVEPGARATWRADVLAPDRTRTDLECWWGDDPAPHVAIEALLGDELTEDHVRTYLLHLQERVGERRGEALMGVLVPEHRRAEAERVLHGVVQAEQSQVTHVVWSYDQVLGALSESLGASPDVEQLRGFVRSCEALDLPPFSEAELKDVPASRRADVVALADRATAAVHPAGERLLPGSEDSDFEWRRYVEVTPGGTDVAVGLPKAAPADAVGPRTPLWLRVHRDTVGASEAARKLAEAYPHTTVADAGSGHTWLPLPVPANVAGAAMVSSVSARIVEALQAINDES